MKTLAKEKAAAGKIIDRALAKGYLVSVNDGEEWVVKKSTKRKQIYDALASTDSDLLKIRNAAGESLGSIYLVWGNSAEELCNDYTDNPEIAELVGD